MNSTAVGFVNGPAAADMVREALEDAGYNVKLMTLVANIHWQVRVEGELDEVLQAEVSGMVSGVCWTLRNLTESGVI